MIKQYLSSWRTIIYLQICSSVKQQYTQKNSIESGFFIYTKQVNLFVVPVYKVGNCLCMVAGSGCWCKYPKDLSVHHLLTYCHNL